MFNFIRQLIIVLALLGIIIVFSRKNPTVAKKEKQLLTIFNFKKINFRQYFKLIKTYLAKLKTKIQKHIKKRQKIIEVRKKTKSGIEAMIEEQKYIKIIVRDPKNLFAYHKLGRLYLEQKNYDDAEAVFEQILKIDQQNKKAKEMLKKIDKILAGTSKPE